MKIRIGLLALITLALGCHHLPYAEMPVFTRKGWHKVRIEGEINVYRLGILREALENLPEKMTNSVKYAVYYSNPEHLASSYCGNKEYSLAHALGSTICFNANGLITKSNVYHEVTHLYVKGLSRAVEREWEKISGNIYRPNYRDYYTNFHEFGVADAYGLVNAEEDIATTVEEIYDYCANSNTRLEQTIAKFTPENKKKMLLKLKILLEVGVIDEKIHGKIKALCEN